MTNEKHFPKIISQWEFDYGLFTKFIENYCCSWLFSEFTQTQKSYPTSWQNMYPNLKTTCHIKLKFFLWTKLLENLLQAKYLTSVAAPLTFQSLHQHAKFSSVHPLFHPFTLWPPGWPQPFLTTSTPIFFYQLLIHGINM